MKMKRRLLAIGNTRLRPTTEREAICLRSALQTLRQTREAFWNSRGDGGRFSAIRMTAERAFNCPLIAGQAHSKHFGNSGVLFSALEQARSSPSLSWWNLLKDCLSC